MFVELAVLKALGDETRYAMYRELSTSTTPLSAQDLADRLGVHANTVRLHLDRLRDAGIVDAEAIHRGTVGRPQHLYFLADGAPGLGFDPPAHALLAGLLGSLAERLGADPDDAAETGEPGVPRPARRTRTTSCLACPRDELSGWASSPPSAQATAPRKAARASTSCTARSASSPRPTPSWSATSTGASARAWSISRRGKRCGVLDVVRPRAVPRDGRGRVRPIDLNRTN